MLTISEPAGLQLLWGSVSLFSTVNKVKLRRASIVWAWWRYESRPLRPAKMKRGKALDLPQVVWLDLKKLLQSPLHKYKRVHCTACSFNTYTQYVVCRDPGSVCVCVCECVCVCPVTLCSYWPGPPHPTNTYTCPLHHRAGPPHPYITYTCPLHPSTTQPAPVYSCGVG